MRTTSRDVTRPETSRSASPRPSRLTASASSPRAAGGRAALARIARADPRLNAFSAVLADEARAEADAATGSSPAGDARPAARRTDRHQGGDRRRRHGDDVRRRGQLDPGRRRRRVVGGCAPPARSSSARPRCRSSGPSPTPSRPRAASPATPGTQPHARRLQRRHGGRRGRRAWCRSAIGGDGGGSIRIPSACCGLFGLKPQRGRVTTAPEPHLWWALGTAGPLTRTVLDSAIVYDVDPRQPRHRPVPRRGRPRRSPRPRSASPDDCGSAGRRRP